MANYISGDFTEVTCSHPTLGEFRFQPKANEDFTVDRGGVSTADDENNVTANGTMIQNMVRALWSVEGDIAVDIKSDIELKGINDMGGSAELGNWTFTHVSGAVYRGSGKPVGRAQLSTNSGTITLKVAGGGELEIIQ